MPILKTVTAVTDLPVSLTPPAGPAGYREWQSCGLPHHPPQSSHREWPCQS